MRAFGVVQQWTVPSSSSSGSYIVTEHVSGEFSCGCKGWTLHSPRRDCKHIAIAKAGLARSYDPLLAEIVIARHREERRLAKLAEASQVSQGRE